MDLVDFVLLACQQEKVEKVPVPSEEEQSGQKILGLQNASKGVSTLDLRRETERIK